MLKNKLVWVGLGVIGVTVGAWLAFGFFGIHKAFIDDEVSDDGPIFASGAQIGDTSNVDDTPVSDSPSDPTTEESPEGDVNDETVETAEGEIVEDETGEGETPQETTTTAAAAEEPVQPQVVTEKTGSFSGLKNYSVSGTATVLTDGAQRFIRFEDGFESDNGPDLKVYLRADNGEFINLGNLEGNKGSQNYEVDISVDLEKYKKVEIWCERFSVGFGSATLS